MLLKLIELRKFRNYLNLAVQPSPSLNVFYGFNAQGKTNLLESIYYLATTHSHRSFKDNELINWGSDGFNIKGLVQRQDRQLDIEICYQENGQKILKISGIKQLRLPDYVGSLSVVLFSPEDLAILKGGPKERRKFIDRELAQISKHYTYLLLKYHKVLEQRNSLLKTAQDKRKLADQLDIWSVQLVGLGSQILSKRFELIKKLALLARASHKQVSAGKENLEIKYFCSIPARPDFSINEIAAVFEKKLAETQNEELKRGSTLVGPHRDDLTFYLNNVDIRLFGSQGQQRTTALSLKLAELELIKQETKEYPVLLLDDVFSELDSLRRHFLLTAVRDKVQTFITTTNLEYIDQSLLSESQIYRVEEGQLLSNF